MSSAPKSDYEQILKLVRAWPPQQRFTLVQDVLKTLAPTIAAEHPRQPTLDRARGLLATDRPPPTDAQIARWLDERSSERSLI